MWGQGRPGRQRLLITNGTAKGQQGYLRNKNDNCVCWEPERWDNFNLNLNVQFCNFSDLPPPVVKIINERLDIYFLRLQTYPHYIYQNFIIGLKDILLSFNAFRLLCQFFLAVVTGQTQTGLAGPGSYIGNI